MDIVYHVRGDVHGALEAEGRVRAPDVVVYRLGRVTTFIPASEMSFALFCVPLPPR